MPDLRQGVGNNGHAPAFARALQPRQKIAKISQPPMGSLACLAGRRACGRPHQNLHQMPEGGKAFEIQIKVAEIVN